LGQGRFRVNASEWPVRRKPQSLHSFLRYPTAPLSAKATAGFLSRAEVAPLKFDDGFLDAIRAHLKRVAAA
jgi:DNA (cytosine-5)-methyltransferase 1